MKILKNKGIVTLPTIMIMGMMALAIVVSITAISFNELLISQSSNQSTKALFYAESGIRDALLKIVRNKNYTCSTADCYMIDFISNGCSNNTDCAVVTVSPGLGTTNDPKIIISKGIMMSSVRTIKVDVILDEGSTSPNIQNGEITSIFWSELIE